MKLSCTQENLNQGLFIVGHLATKNNTLPILQNVLIQAKENTVTFCATNLEIGVICQVRGTVEEEGEFTVQSKLLSDYISLLPKERIDLSAPNTEDVDQVLEVKAKNNQTKIKGQAATDFPVIPVIEKNNPYLVAYENFRQAIGQVIFAVSISETRPEINGVLFVVKDNSLLLAATDSYRLAERRVSLNEKSNTQEQRIIVPARTLQELQRILGSFKDPADIAQVEMIELYIADNQILFKIGSIELISRLIDGQYPDYEQIIPTSFTTSVTVPVDELSKAVRTAGLFTRTGIHDVRLRLTPSKGIVAVSAASIQVGENTTELIAEGTGDEVTTILNYRYLLDGLQSIADGKATIVLTDANSPCVIKPADKTVAAEHQYILMPIKQ